MNQDKVTEEGKKREVSKGRSKTEAKEERNPDGLNYSNQNTLILNTIC